jgi:hypothetical protein
MFSKWLGIVYANADLRHRDRANMRFADVEHSGRADIIHLDKYTGAATQFQNLGHSPGGGGSSFSWANKGVRYSPVDRGECMVRPSNLSYREGYADVVDRALQTKVELAGPISSMPCRIPTEYVFFASSHPQDRYSVD